MGNKENKNMKMFVMRSDGKTYDSLDDVFQEVAELTLDGGNSKKCSEPTEQENDYLQIAQEVYSTFIAFQQVGFTQEQAFKLLLLFCEAVLKED